MGKLLIIKGADFSQVAVDTITTGGRIRINVVANPSIAGTVTGGGLYNEGDEIQISAVPAAGYMFTRWNDGDTNATRTITVGSSSATYTASFEVKTYQLIEDRSALTYKQVGSFNSGSIFYAFKDDSTPADTINKVILYLHNYNAWSDGYSIGAWINNTVRLITNYTITSADVTAGYKEIELPSPIDGANGEKLYLVPSDHSKATGICSCAQGSGFCFVRDTGAPSSDYPLTPMISYYK